MVDRERLISALAREMPSVLRWSGAVATQLRGHNVALGEKGSGFAATDALTLADLSVQELLVAALRDADPIFRECRIEAEETTGDLGRFAADSEYVLALDPIDGTKQYRDRTGDGWSVMLHLRTATELLYSLVYAPAAGDCGRWVEVRDGKIVAGDDDFGRPAREVLDAMPPAAGGKSDKIYMIGFVGRERESVAAVTAAGLTGVDADDTPGCLYDLLATGEFGGSLIHSPNVYDFPVSTQIVRERGGDSVWVRTGEPVHFRDLWMDERSKMWRLRGIVATAFDRGALRALCEVAKGWDENRYAGRN